MSTPLFQRHKVSQMLIMVLLEGILELHLRRCHDTQRSGDVVTQHIILPRGNLTHRLEPASSLTQIKAAASAGRIRSARARTSI